jgi:hypothetical protein
MDHGLVLTGLHGGGHRFEQFRVTLAQVGGAQHADEIDDFIAIDILVALSHLANTINKKGAGG